jgi:hypothetical protein
MTDPKLVHDCGSIRFEAGGFPYPMGLPAMHLIEMALRGTFKNINFEHVIAALEELETICDVRMPRADEYIHVLTAITEIKRKFEPINQMWIVQQMRRLVVNTVCKSIIDRLNLSATSSEVVQSRDLYNKFFALLNEHFRLRIFTLNYDDFIDDILPFNDGFMEPVAVEGYGQFIRHKFMQQLNDDGDLLIHLHGSLRFGYARPGAIATSTTPSELVKYSDSSAAYNSILGIQVSDTISQGSLIPSTPIISGFSKTEKLQERPVPFGYYLNAFVDCLTRCQRVLIIGYGGNDEYINSWLLEHRELRRHDPSKPRRIAIVNKLCGDSVGKNTPVRGLIERLAMQEPNAIRDAFYNISAGDSGQEVWNNNDMQVVCSGFPVSQEIGRTILNFLLDDSEEASDDL